MHVSTDESFDFGYALRRPFWHRRIATEAARAVLERLQRDGIPYVTATHDVNNPRSGAVMRKLGNGIGTPTRSFGSRRAFRLYFGCIN